MTCRRSSMSELFELLDRLQSSRLDDQRCEMPQVPEHPLQKPFDNLYSISTYGSTLISPAPPPPLSCPAAKPGTEADAGITKPCKARSSARQTWTAPTGSS